MERKKIAPNSFQQEIVEFLKAHFPGSFTGKEILKEINRVNKSLGKEERSIGSLSGTLKVLYQSGWVLRSDEYPSRYSYQHEQDARDTSLDVVKSTNAAKSYELQTSQDPILQSIQNKVREIKLKIAAVDNQMEQLKAERSTLQVQLEPLEEILIQYR